MRSTPRGATADAVSVFLGGARLSVALAAIDSSERIARLTVVTAAPLDAELRKSTPPQIRELNLEICDSKQQVDDFVGELTF